jgi:hypothetical protein
MKVSCGTSLELESPTAQVCAVTHGTVSEDKDGVELETSKATHVSPTNKRNKIGSISSNDNNKEATFSSFYKIISLNPHKQQQIRKRNRKYTTKRSPR